MKPLAAALVTLVILGLLVFHGSSSVVVRPPTARDAFEGDGPESVVRRALGAARVGDVPTYLEQFRGPLREQLGEAPSRQGAERGASELREAAARRKSHAVFAGELDGPPEQAGTGRVRVESVFPDMIEQQT